MKTRLRPLSLLLTLASFPAAVTATPIAVTGTMTYSQNFDTALGTGSPAWVDDSTIPGWYAQINNGTTPSGNANAADGTVVLDGLLNCGTVDDPDRALGSKATGTNNFANIAYAVSFHNTSTNPVQWTGLHYTGECWRTNSSTNGTTAETFITYYQVSSTAVTNIISGPSNAVAAAGTGFTALGTAGNWTATELTPVATAKNGNVANNFSAVNYAPAAPIVLQPGQFLTIKWTDTNLGGTDGFQAIDDVGVDFVQLDGSVVATASQRTREFNGTPTVLTDDTFGFTALISGSGAVSTWTATGATPPFTNASSGPYGTPVIWTGFPLTGPKNVNVTDAVNPAFTASLNVQPLLVIGSNDMVTAGMPILQEDAVINGWTIDDATRTLTQTNQTVQTDFVVNSEIIDLSTTGFLQFKATLNAKTGASSGFEAADRFALQLIIDGGAPISVLGATDTNNDGYLTGVAAATPSPELPGVDDRNADEPFNFSYIIPESANTVQIRIIGSSNSAAETYEVKNIKLVPPPPTIVASLAGASVFDNKGTVNTADDEFSTPVTLTAVNLGGSPGWNSNSTPASGVYSPPAVTFGPYLVASGPQVVTVVDQTNVFVSAQVTLPVPPSASIAVSAPTAVTRVANGPGLADDTVTFQAIVTGVSTGPFWNATGAIPGTGVYSAVPVTFTIQAPLPASPASITITDASYPGATRTFTVPIPAIYTLGERNFGVPTPIFSLPVVTPDTAWVNDATARTLTMTDGDAPGAGTKTITSEVVDLTGIAGNVRFSANLHVHDATSGFEALDTFNAYLIYDGNAASPVSLITPYDTDASGNLTGAELAPVPNPNPSAQDHDYPLSAIIPDNVVSVQLVIAGLNDSANETMTVSNILIDPAPITSDADGDGISNADEAIMGTDPNDPNSALRLTQNPADPLQLSFPTVATRYYKVYVSNDANPSTHLQAWSDAGMPTIVGDGNPASFSITVSPGQVRRYYRLQVMQADGPWLPVP